MPSSEIPETSPTKDGVLDTLKTAASLVRSRFSAWMLFTQVVAFLSAGALLLQDLLLRILGVGFLFSAFLLWPLYASLYSVARKLIEEGLALQGFRAGFSVLGRSLGLTFLHNLISFIVFFPFYMMISLFLFSKLGWTPDQFSSPGAFGEEHIRAFLEAASANWPRVLLLALPAWPLQVYVQSRLFVAYHYVVHFRWPVFVALSHSLRETSKGQWRRFLLVCVAEFSFPVLFPFFLVSYPFKYAIYACLLRELEGKERGSTEKAEAFFPNRAVPKNPYLESSKNLRP